MRAIVCVALLGALVASPAAAEFDPFDVPREEFRETVKTVVISPPVASYLPIDLPEDLEQRFEDDLRRDLESVGIRVIPSSEYARIWLAMSERLGGTYDRNTGAQREDTWKLARDQTLRELQRIEQIDAVVDPRIRFQDSTRWGSPGVSANRYEGLWLGVVVRDLNEKTLFSIAVPAGWIDAYFSQSRYRIQGEGVDRLLGANAVAATERVFKGLRDAYR